MSLNQCVLIVGQPISALSDIIKAILKVEELPPPSEIENGILSYPWKVDTKYYTATVDLCCTDVKSLGSQSFANAVEAVVIYFDSTVKDGLADADGWLSFMKEYEPEVKILLCDHCESEAGLGTSKLAAQEWCIGKGFELVELSPELDDADDEENDFAESTGVCRIIQALHAHVWPNMIMKQNNGWTGSNHNQTPNDLVSELQSLNIDAPFTPGGPEIEDKLEELFSEGSQELEFSELFSELRTMKERVSNLPSEERKACAEKVVLAFWKAIGGDDDEISATANLKERMRIKPCINLPKRRK